MLEYLFSKTSMMDDAYKISSMLTVSYAPLCCCAPPPPRRPSRVSPVGAHWQHHLCTATKDRHTVQPKNSDVHETWCHSKDIPIHVAEVYASFGSVPNDMTTRVETWTQSSFSDFTYSVTLWWHDHTILDDTHYVRQGIFIDLWECGLGSSYRW